MKTMRPDDISVQTTDVAWQDMQTGCTICGSGTSADFNTGEWRVMKPLMDWDKCRQCLLCVPVCPDSSIPVKDRERLEFDYDHCKGCGICAANCPFDAIEMKEV